MPNAKRSPYLQAISADDSLPIEAAAVALWMQDLENKFRWVLRPILQFFFAILLHIVWFIKRLPLPQFSAHSFLQKTICWFCTHFVSPEANLLILRHFATESNILNFLSENTGHTHTVNLYPKKINDMLTDTFVNHDQELFDCFIKLGAKKLKIGVKKLGTKKLCSKKPDSTANFEQEQELHTQKYNWSNWQPIDMDEFTIKKRATQILDFETSHALFMCLFCLLLKKDEYRDAINGFNLDQSIAIRIGEIIGDSTLTEYAYNKYPQYLVGPWNLGQRFLMHGFFTEYLYAKLEDIRMTQLNGDAKDA